MIADLKAQLLAPSKVQPKAKQEPQKQEEPDDKYQKVMAWGTPRLVTNNKNKEGGNGRLRHLHLT